ncbi:MAG: hypothetical protein LBG07_10940 [Treponema sp.]|jgi:hypothetical protein|nr:hypothetical protein [Treponema sp.]
MKLRKESWVSPPALFVYYMLASFLVILVFRFFFPRQGAPLSIFSRDWRFTLGILEILSLSPALAFSGLTIPFGFRIYYNEYKSFSPHFLEQFRGIIVTAILAAIVYALFFFLVQPVFQNKRIDMSYQGSMYRLARDLAKDCVEQEKWNEAADFLNIAAQVWPGSPELAEMREKTEIELEEERIRSEGKQRTLLEENEAAEDWSLLDNSIPGSPSRGTGAASGRIAEQRQPLNTLEALDMAATAIREERYYDAHWLATLGVQLAQRGSPEEASASRAAGLAWDKISSLAPNIRERELYARFQLKQSGYEAMIAGDWIRAYYIFRELLAQNPGDPDVKNFLQKSEQGTQDIAFFTDEMSRGVGSTLTNAIFSLPYQPRSGGIGRGIIRFDSISLYQDYGYGLGVEFICFDSANRPESRFHAPYAKIIPMTLGDQSRVVVLMHALDRDDKNRHWEPVWNSLETAGSVRRSTMNANISGAAGGFFRSLIGDNQVMLDLNFESFSLLCYTWRGLANPPGSKNNVSPLDGFSLGDLLAGSRALSSYGYIPQVFEAEIIYRLCEPLFFLPMAIFIIIIGWRFRALSHARYVFVPMLFILPLVFYELLYFYRHILNILGIYSVLNLGFSLTLIIYCISAGVLFVLSLVAFSSQHS